MRSTTAPTRGPTRPASSTLTEMLRWGWRQLTSMRTALILLLLLALAAIPGSVVPQSDVDSLKTARWQDAHPNLTPVYEKLGLFSVYDSPWFSAIYILLMVSLVGCFVPRTVVYWKAMRAAPPPRPPQPVPPARTTRRTTRRRRRRRSSRPPRPMLERRSYRVVRDRGRGVGRARATCARRATCCSTSSVLVVLVGFALGRLFGYRGGVILVVGNGFSNNLTQYDDFAPGSLFEPNDMEPFTFDVDDFDVEWLTEGPSKGQARGFVSHLTYQESPTAEPKEYDLKVNHPLAIGDTEVFLIGHGYAPVITIRDGNGDIAYSGPTIFLPTDPTFRSFGVVKAPDAKPAQIGLEGEFYPTYAFTPESGPFSIFGNAANPAISMLVYAGDLGMDTGQPQSVYSLDKDGVERVDKADGSMFRVDLGAGTEVELPDGLGTVSFDGLERWNKMQISRTPGKFVALTGVGARA